MSVMKIENYLYFAAKKTLKNVRRFIPASMRIAVKESMVNRRLWDFLKVKESCSPECFPKGINLIGSICAEMGLGQSCRLVAHELERCEVRFSIYNISLSEELREQDTSYANYISTELPYGINLFHVNPCELGNVFMARPEMWNGRYNIAFWLWELEDFPQEWVKYCNLFDEIWTPSEFAGRSIQAKTNVPVRTMPYSVDAPFSGRWDREWFHLPTDKFLYLIMYDSNSTSGRKNPQGAITAYKKAYPQERGDCGLVIKINNARPVDIKKLKKELSGYQNVYFITDTLTKEQANSLIKIVDVYVSLHRSEGFGLVLAEAMQLGVPVIATGWSSNTEFMDSESTCLVKYKLVKNKKREGLYKKGCIWAEPDTDDAAEYMRKLRESQEYYATKAVKGKAYLNCALSEEKLTNLWMHYLQSVMEEF